MNPFDPGHQADHSLPPGADLYPATRRSRDRWIVENRSERRIRDPWIPYSFFVEPEMGPRGSSDSVTTIFLTNRECPFRCLMCDLWQDTLLETVPPGAITAQIRFALDRLPLANRLKLYNAGSFFDLRAIPQAEYPAIAEIAATFSQLTVECHPALVGPSIPRFRDAILRRNAGKTNNEFSLEVALGLETVHPTILERLNKRMTTDDYRSAANFLTSNGVHVRAFILLRPPWLTETEGLEWAKKSLDFAFETGADVCTLIPTRAGNGAMDALARSGHFHPPSLRSMELALEYGIALNQGRVFADLWDFPGSHRCEGCDALRLQRLAIINRTQQIPASVDCNRCGMEQ